MELVRGLINGVRSKKTVSCKMLDAGSGQSFVGIITIGFRAITWSTHMKTMNNL